MRPRGTSLVFEILLGSKRVNVFDFSLVLTLEQAESLCTVVFEEKKKQLKSRVLQKYEERRQALQEIVTRTATQQQTLSNR